VTEEEDGVAETKREDFGENNCVPVALELIGRPGEFPIDSSSNLFDERSAAEATIHMRGGMMNSPSCLEKSRSMYRAGKSGTPDRV